MSKELAERVLEYLNNKGMAFCWLEDGQFVSREDCIKVINK